MMLDDHVDKDCFELFVRSGVYIKYAEEFLQAEQIDRIDINEYLS